MPTELELIALETEFELYLTFTKRLVLNLPDSDDRTRAAIWLQKLRSVTNDEQKKLRNEHLKLLLFALHRRSMLSVFAKPPPEELESFHDGLTLLEMTRELIELTEKKQAGVENTGECPLPPVSTSISADLKEYCASQSIPKFGAHVFYAVSNEPIQMWSKSPNCVCPDASEIPNPLQWELRLSRLTDHVLETQAEADRLVAEAEKGDKTEMQMKEHDDTHILPKIELDQVSKKEVPFQWKPDSLLLLHQNYDFTDVGVAEDLEEQGKMQLELDEMALDIVGHSLPGRQRVVVRDPYYKGMPPDFSERRNHGVVDDVSSSSSSDEMESSQAMGSTSYTQDERQSETSRQNGTQNQNFTSEMSTKNFPTSSNDDLGPLARKYLPPSSKSRFGLHLDNDTNEYKVGEMSVSFEGDDILVDFDGNSERFTGTEGLWRLMTQDVEDMDYKKNNFTNTDWNVYKEIIIRANPNRGDSAGMSHFCFLSFACYLFKKWMWQVNGGEEEGKSGGDTFDVNDEGCYF